MNSKGEVRSASEFKDIFDDIGESHGPYKCPFCEARYEDRCIVTDCVKAPHFKLPNGAVHADGCNGETGDGLSVIVKEPAKATKRKVVGEIEIPEALVNRRKALTVRKPGGGADGAPPDATEILRRRRLVASDKTISSHYTTSLLKALVVAYEKLRKHAGKTAVEAGHAQGTPDYNTSFRNTLKAFPLSLYEQKLTYGNAFQGKKLQPSRLARIYHGYGTVLVEGDYLVIKDSDSWPKKVGEKTESVPLRVMLGRTLAADAPTSHVQALKKLELHAAAGKSINWYAYGLPVIKGDGYELIVDTLDHLYWPDQYNR
jgi:hypothetical protein